MPLTFLPAPDIERVNRRIEYNPITGLFRRKDFGYGEWQVGGRIGAKSRHRRFKIDGVNYLAHRLAWFIVYGEWPDGEIDHINHLADDNRIVNLRVATRNQNQWNRRANRNSALGLKGVFQRPKCKRYYARIRANNKMHLLGSFATAEEAQAAYVRAAERLFGEFAFQG